MSKSFTARWILTAAGPPVENGILVVRKDKIEAIEPKGTRKADVDLGNVALIPGLVNAHTHLDLSVVWGLIPPTDPEHFTDWLKGVIAYRRTRTTEQVQQDIRDGLAECLQAGTTLLGDIAAEGVSWDVVAEAPIRSWIFFELIGLDEAIIVSAARRTGRLVGWAFDSPRPPLICGPDTSQTKGGLSPHAPYSVNGRVARNILSCVIPTATHVGETPQECDFLEHNTGPFKDFLIELGVYQPAVIVDSWTRYLSPWNELSVGIVANCLVIHANYLPAEFHFRSYHTVVYCPRTHAAFGHPPHPFREFMKRGVRVCLGTDSLASNPDLDILAEARFVKERYPDFDGETLLKMVTLFGAEALGWADECGSLEAVKSADAVAVPLRDRDGDPYDLLFVDPAPGERRTMFRGEWRTAGVSRPVNPRSSPAG